MAYILVIEDNVPNADMIKLILESAGYEVRHFSRGFDGSKSARAERPALIIMDFNLPDIDGRTLAFLLKRQLGETLAPPIVACTARTGDREKRLAAAMGCSAFLSKPFTPDELLAVVFHFVPRTMPTSGNQLA